MGCFPCFKSSNGSKKCWKCWKRKSSIGDDTLRKRKRKGICLSSKMKGCACCFICGKSSKDEEPTRKRGECGMGCFCCYGSSKEEDPSAKGTKCGISCFKHTKNSSKEPSTRKGKGWMSCFCCCKPSEGKELRLGKEKGTSCCTCFNLSDRIGCFHCFKPSKRKGRAKSTPQCVTESSKQRPPTQEIIRIGNENIAARVFTYHKLSESTQKFSPECLLGEGGLGKVYKGQLKDANEIIAVKKINRNECQENREFLIEVLMLSLLSHPNLVSLLGYCVEGDERFLVYEYMPLGSLQDHLLDLSPNSKPLDWNTRMKIAVGAAKGLEHLHDTANPPVIFRNLKASNILLDEDYNARLADFGLEKFGPVRDKNHISARVMGTYGYCAPEYALTGKLTVMSDIYSFGVVLLELITGRKAMDSTRPINEQRLVDWAMPRFKNKSNFVHMADPLLERNFPEKALYQAIGVAAMCIQEEDTTRPLIKDIVNTLQFLATEMPEEPMNKNQNHDEPQAEKSIDATSNTDEESLHSSLGEWQSCSPATEDEE